MAVTRAAAKKQGAEISTSPDVIKQPEVTKEPEVTEALTSQAPNNPKGVTKPKTKLKKKPAAKVPTPEEELFKRNMAAANAMGKPAGLKEAKDLKDDLKAFGFTNPQVDGMIARPPGFEVDTTMQRPQFHKEAEQKRVAEQAKKEQQRNKKGPNYEPLQVKPNAGNWTLLDPAREKHHCGCVPPQIFDMFATYVPGNKKILEFNAVSQSVRIGSTPPSLQGKAVEYTRTGPKIVDIKATKKGGVKNDEEDAMAAVAAFGEKMKKANGGLQKKKFRARVSSSSTEDSELEVAVDGQLEGEIEVELE